MRADGYIICVDPDRGTKEADTKQCCHCGTHFPYQKGSGRIRGKCMLCDALTCGDPKCHEHFPIEERMDLYEQGKLPHLMSPREQAIVKRIVQGG